MRRYYSRAGTSLFDWQLDADLNGTIESSERNGNILKVLDRAVPPHGFIATMNAFDELVSYRRPAIQTPECVYKPPHQHDLDRT